jgi:hypothetical protein
MKVSATASVPAMEQELLELLKARKLTTATSQSVLTTFAPVVKIEKVTVDGPHRGDSANDLSYKM